jgi:hypothetical protein
MPLLRYRSGNAITARRYGHLWQRAGQQVSWVHTPAGVYALAAPHHTELVERLSATRSATTACEIALGP